MIISPINISPLSPKRSGVGATPSNTIAPVISGSTTVGSVLTTTDGTWTGTAPITYTYQWNRSGVAISGATSNTYTTVNANIGENITCTVTATNAFGSDTATSNTIVVVDKTLCSYYFDATNNQVVLPTSMKTIITGVGKEFSVTIVFKAFNNGIRIFDNWGGTATVNKSTLIAINVSGFLQLFLSSDGITNSGNWTSTNTVSLNVWHELIVNYNNGVVSVFLDGSSFTGTSTTIPTTLFANSISPIIGGYLIPTDGYVNQFMCVDRVLTSLEATNLWNGGSPRIINELISNDYTYIFDNDTWDGSNFTVINSESGGNAVTSGMSAVDKDCNENPY